MPSPQATIYPRFAAQVSNLQQQATNVSESIRGKNQRKWRIPDSWNSDVFMIPLYAPPFKRSEMNSAYPNFFVGGGTVNDAAATKWQAVHLSGQERAFRLQEQSGIRCAMHAAARRSGHGDPSVGNFARIVDHIIDMIVEGGF